ncbi:hypothetical protein ACFVUY_33825 [Kitasatospora sp. NPDC058063]|uniref:hypothetical protein n=1 Tax=unclassified Kitasatospora TaxID=2633591 RepID=UPI0036DDF6F8
MDALARLSAIEQALTAERTLLLAEASYLGATWQQMAKICGVTKQSLHKRYADAARRVMTICSDPHPEKPLRLIMELHQGTFHRLLRLGVLITEPARHGEHWRPGFRRHVHATALAGQQAVREAEVAHSLPATIPAQRALMAAKHSSGRPRADPGG